MSRERVHTRFLLAALIAVLICIGRGVYGRPWDLSSYKLCKEVGLRGIDDNASGASYNPVTDSLWVITRTPKSLLEYTPRGELKREVSWSGFDDPEGMPWVPFSEVDVGALIDNRSPKLQLNYNVRPAHSLPQFTRRSVSSRLHKCRLIASREKDSIAVIYEQINRSSA